MKKNLLLSVGIILYYMFIVFMLEGQVVIFPTFMISVFYLSMLLSKKEIFFSFIPITSIWLIQPFLPNTILYISILYIIFTPLTFWLGYCLKNKSWLSKILYPILLILIPFYSFSNLWSLEQNIFARQDSIVPKIKLFTEQNKVTRLDTIKNKIIVLDFWTTSCAVCFQKFPAYEELFLEYQNNPNVEMYVVNIPTKKDSTGRAKRMINTLEYKFPKLYAKSDSIPKSLGFHSYPHLTILKNGKIRFNGSLIVEKDIFLYKLEDEIQLLLNEDSN